MPLLITDTQMKVEMKECPLDWNKIMEFLNSKGVTQFECVIMCIYTNNVFLKTMCLTLFLLMVF